MSDNSAMSIRGRLPKPNIAAVLILLLAVGKARPPYADDVDHYLRHLRVRARVEQAEVKDAKAALARIPSGSFTVALDPGGREMDSVAFAGFIEERRMEGRTLCFVVGGADGIEVPGSDLRLSLGPMTLPHQLARVVVLEQLLRAHAILAGEPYHR